MFLQKWILSPQGSPAKSESWNSPKSALFCSVSHMTIFFVFTCVMNVGDQTRWSFVTSFDPWSIVQVCSLTIEYQVHQFVPSFSISEQFESIHLIILQQISILLLWNDGRQCKELILRRVVESSCSPTHNIARHISSHDPPCHKTMKKNEDFPSTVVFQFHLRKFGIQTWFCNCPQYLCLFRIVVECIPSIHDQGMMLVLPNQLLCFVLSTSD